MKPTQKNLTLLTCLFVMTILVGNILASKICLIGPFVVPSAISIYWMSYLFTDVIGEQFGKKEANQAVRFGFYCQLIMIGAIYLAIQLPIAPFADNQDAFKNILGGSLRIFIASSISYIVSQSWDVFIFHKIRNQWGTDKKYLRNNLSTLSSQAIDTIIFITIAFYGLVPNIWIMIGSQYLFKVGFALLDTIPFYLLTKNSETYNPVNKN